MDCRGNTALITGGGHRVGKAITMALAEAGANVVINYHASADAAQATAVEVRALGVDALPFQANVANQQQVEAMVAAASDRLGSIDILINSASRFEKTPFPAQDVAAWHRVLDILIHGPFYCANAIAPMMLERGRGVIINIVDLFGRWGIVDDVAQAVMYLIQADYVTGEVIIVDGGERYGHRKP